MTLMRLLLLGMATAVFAPACASQRRCWRAPESEPRLYCVLEAPSQVRAGEPIPTTVTLRNVSPDQHVFFRLREVLPHADAAGALFVRGEGGLVPYAGSTPRRSFTVADVAGLAPGTSAAGTVDLLSVFPGLRAPGRYEVIFRGYLADRGRGPDPKPSRQNAVTRDAVVACNQVVLTVSPARAPIVAARDCPGSDERSVGRRCL